MSMLKLAIQNARSGMRNYLSLIISLAFTILILCNFINLVDSGILDQLGESNARNIEVILQILSFVIGCFMFFFIWYATNVFLTKCKKEIGIYVFMGLSNQEIGKLYATDILFIGSAALINGLLFGILTSQLFTMILMRLSTISVEIYFDVSVRSLLMTVLIFVFIYGIFVIKGYLDIVHSSVLEMIAANRQNEAVKQNRWLLAGKALSGVILISTGCYFAIKDAGMEVVGNLLLAVVLVVTGIYFIFGGLIPLLFQSLAHNKKFLYKKERNLWINSIIFRMKKNYRTYAIVCILMLCAITALAFGIAMKNRYDNIVHFENTYTYQIMSDQAGYHREFHNLIEKQNEVSYQSEAEITMLHEQYISEKFTVPIAIIAYTDVKNIAQTTGLPFNIKEPKDGEYVELNRLYLMSLTNESIGSTQEINGISYTSVDQTTAPYLGYMQEDMDYMIVNDSTYQQLKLLGTSVYMYNYKISDPSRFERSEADIRSSSHCLGLVKVDPERAEISWIKILFSVSVFMFMVFILASGSILFMKIYNDSFEEQARYHILSKLGIDDDVIKRSITYELLLTFVMPLLAMSCISYFSIKAIGELMQTTLPFVNVISLAVIYVCFFLFYLLSRFLYIGNVKKAVNSMYD